MKRTAFVVAVILLTPFCVLISFFRPFRGPMEWFEFVGLEWKRLGEVQRARRQHW